MRRLLVPALLVYSIILYRAAHQAVTHDEADAFLNFATGNLDMSFYPSSGNHVLNSLLARFSTQVFGLSQFTFRLPSMFGAAIYLFAATAIVTRLTRGRRTIQFLGFAILTLNPFVLDYLIASRGYAMAVGFLAAAVAMAMKIIEENPPLRCIVAGTVLISICGALSIAANFSFAFAIISTIAAYLLTLLLTKMPFSTWMAVAAASALPGMTVGLALVGHTLRDFPRDQLYYGAQAWTEMWSGMLDASYPRQNLSIQAVDLEPILTAVHHAAAYFVLVPLAIAAWTALATRTSPIRFVWLALIFTLTAHGLAHAMQGLLLPLDRTSLFIAFFLSVVVVQGAAAAPATAARTAATAFLCGSVLVFALAFRTNYFRIWDFDLDIDKGFATLSQYAVDHPVNSAGCTWRYGGPYNFYRMAAGSGSALPACDPIDQDNPPLRSAYFIHSPGQDEFVAKAKLKVIYRGPVSGIMVAVSPRTNENEPPE